MSNPDEKKIHSYQDWLTWDGTWELINGKAYNMSPAPTSRLFARRIRSQKKAVRVLQR